MTANVTWLSAEARADIQGFVTSGYGDLPFAAYIFVKISDEAGARRWLGQLVPTVTSTFDWPEKARRIEAPSTSVNVCFTADGLRACGLTDDVMCTFPPEFREGIVTPARSRILGDTQDSDPSRWEFGGPGAEPLHALLIVHGYTEEALVAACTAQRDLIAGSNGAVSELGVDEQRGVRPTGDYEPFGFHDGISQPKIDGLKGPGVPAGEFILGYLNHYGLIAGGPVVPRTLDPSGVLPALENPHHLAANLADLGRHGSYVVYRKLEQDVAGFWRFMRDEAARRGARDVAARAIELAAKCVGRWPSGAPLIESPATDRPGLERFDAFGYAGDPHGLACPIGAHIRRTHPRDDLKPYPTQQSLSMSEAHRLFRRARVFGTAPIEPKQLQKRVAGETLANLPDDGHPRGIHFFCVNASIKSQFEFVQQSWCNNPHFGGLYDNKDPITGDQASDSQAPSYMEIPSATSVDRLGPLPRFVTVRAGAYFFMPGVKALRFMAAT